MRKLPNDRVLQAIFLQVFLCCWWMIGIFLMIASWGEGSLAATITNITPDHGPRGVNTNLIIKGEGFSPGMRVSIWGGGVYIKGSHLAAGPANSLYCSGSYVYLACGPQQQTRAGEGGGVQVFDIHNPSAPQPIGFLPLPAAASDILVFDHYAYVADAEAGLQVLDVENPRASSLVASFPMPTARALKISLYGHYAYLAAEDGGLQIVDVSNPQQPAQAGALSFAEAGSILDVVAEGSYAYLAAGWSGVKIVDISHPRSPRIVAELPCPGRFVIGIYKYQNYLYLSELQDGVEILDAVDPLAPKALFRLSTCGLARQVAIRGNYLYVADDYRGVEIFRHDLPKGCSLVGFQETPGWAVDLQVVDNHVFVADSQGGLQILDAENPRNPSLVSVVDLLEGEDGLEVCGLTLEGNYAYVFSRATPYFGENWLKILDVSHPQNPRLIGKTCNIGPRPAELVISQGEYAYLVDADLGLQVFNVTVRQAPQRVSFYDRESCGGGGISLRDKTLLVADSMSSGRPALKIFSQDTKMLPSALGVAWVDDFQGRSEAIDVLGNYAFLACGEAGVAIFDLQDLRQPVVASTLPLSGSISDILISGPYAYLANRAAGLIQTVGIEQPREPHLVSSCKLKGKPQSLALSEKQLYVAEGESGLEVIDLSQQAFPLAVASLATLTPAEDVAVADGGEYLYLAIRNGLAVMRAFKPCPTVSYIDSETLQVSTPCGLAPGTYHITLTDPNGHAVFLPNGFTVEANRPPLMEPLADKPLIAVAEGQTLTLTIKASDPDGDPLTYDVSLARLPKGATLVGNVFTWQPRSGDSGLYPDIRFQVSDGEFIIEQTINLAVIDNGLDTPPELEPIGNRSISEGDLLSFSLSAKDAEGDSLIFSAEPLPRGAELLGSRFSWRPDFDQSGTYKICFTVREENFNLADSEEITITVTETNQPPELCLIPIQTHGEEGEAMAVAIEVLDPDPQDRQNLTISMLNAPAGALCRVLSGQAGGGGLEGNLSRQAEGDRLLLAGGDSLLLADKALDDQNSHLIACFLWTPTLGQAGRYTITFEASDQRLSARQTITLDIGPATSSQTSIELKPGANLWLCPAGRDQQYTSFAFLRELGEETLSSLQAYDLDGRLLKSCAWLFGRPCGDNFPMNQSLILRLQAKRSISFTWPKAARR